MAFWFSLSLAANPVCLADKQASTAKTRRNKVYVCMHEGVHVHVHIHIRTPPSNAHARRRTHSDMCPSLTTIAHVVAGWGSHFSCISKYADTDWCMIDSHFEQRDCISKYVDIQIVYLSTLIRTGV